MNIDPDIANLDLEPIAFTVCRTEGWSIEKVDAVEHQYRLFLQLIRAGEQELGPTRDVDIFWHAHILDTRAYASDCEALFGRFVHHYPYSGLFGSEDADKQMARVVKTMELIERNQTRKENQNEC
jgi:hypothetical protein